MAETQTAEALSAEVKKQDYGVYNQGRIKLNFDEQTQDWKEQYEPVKGYKMFIPPVPKQVKLPTDVTVPTTPAVEQPTTEVTQPATPLVQQRDGESLAQKQQREMMERFGPGQDPMQMAKTMSNIFTPGTPQNSYYTSMGALKEDGDTLTINFDAIDEKGGYGLPLGLGAAFKFAEKDIIQGTLNKLRYAGILEGSEIQDSKGMFTFNINREKMDSYKDNVASLANTLSGGYRDVNGNYIQRNDYLLGELGKLDRLEVDEFIADLAILSSDDNMKNNINNAISSGDRGAAAALLAFQTGNYLDLDKKGLFGNNFYSDSFKQSYTQTLNSLNEAKGSMEDMPTAEEETTTAPSTTKEEQRQQTSEMKDTFDALVEQAKKSKNPQVKTALLNQASAYSGAGDIAEPKADGTQYPSSYGGVYQGTTPTKTSTSTKTDTTKSSSSGGGNNSSSSSSSSGTRSSLVNNSTSQKLSAAKEKYGSLATKGK